jgi:hypothetical protein
LDQSSGARDNLKFSTRYVGLYEIQILYLVLFPQVIESKNLDSFGSSFFVMRLRSLNRASLLASELKRVKLTYFLFSHNYS